MTRYELSTYPILIQEAQWLAGRIEAMRVKIDAPRIPQLTGQPGARTVLPGSMQERLADEYLDTAPQYEQRLLEVRAHLRRMEDAVDKLPPKERMVTRWHCFDKFSYKYIADMMELSQSVVSKIMMNAYRLLEEKEKE